ncbi:AMP-binding protein [Candidatus Villigracilis affinis]|uniref:AMP-binding protein n=1 Tax=Candidatus Villigracilis affinis TaxID=3140682 RepID=UPI001D8B868A|nr:AMP-binding protein [Anaerolineales bacterium]
MTTLADLIHQNYSKNPEKAAIILQHAGQDDKPVSYHDLVTGSARYARTYAEAGLQPGEVIILILQHGEDLVYSFWGAILHGAIPAIMPFLTEKLSPERYRADLAALLSVTQPTAIVTYPEFESDIRSAMTADSSVRTVLLTSQLAPETEPDFSQLRGLHCKPTDIVLLQHSSGTTGLQKGVALSHEAVLNQLNAYTRALQLTSDDVLVSWLPLYHDMGLIAGFLMPILMGITLVLQSPFDWVRAPHKLFQSVSKYKGTLSWLPNFAYNFCAQKVRERDLEGVDLSSWRVITNCSEPVKWESHQAFFQRFEKYGLRESALNCSYAMAENVFGVTQTPLGTKPVTDEIDRESYINERIANPPMDGKPALKMMSSGRALPNTRLLILSEDGKPLPDKVIGEIALQSDCMLTGYYHRPDATEKALRDGWYLTGDYGYTLNSEVFVAGRKKDMIIVGGKNVYPQDLESLAYEVPGIHAGRAVAFGIEDAKAGTEEVVIVAEVDTENPEERQRIADALRKHITQNSAIALRHAHIVDPKWILKTSSGKTARSANREKFLQELESSS